MKDERNKYVSKTNRVLFQDLIDHLNKVIGGSSNHIMSQRKLAEMLGCGNVTVSRWLKGEIKLRIEDAVKICDILHLDKRKYLREIFEDALSPLEYKILSLSDENIIKILEYIEFLLFKQNNKKDINENQINITEELTNYLIKLGYSSDKILEILSNPTARECVEINWRSTLNNHDTFEYYKNGKSAIKNHQVL